MALLPLQPLNPHFTNPIQQRFANAEKAAMLYQLAAKLHLKVAYAVGFVQGVKFA